MHSRHLTTAARTRVACSSNTSATLSAAARRSTPQPHLTRQIPHGCEVAGAGGVDPVNLHLTKSRFDDLTSTGRDHEPLPVQVARRGAAGPHGYCESAASSPISLFVRCARRPPCRLGCGRAEPGRSLAAWRNLACRELRNGEARGRESSWQCGGDDVRGRRAAVAGALDRLSAAASRCSTGQIAAARPMSFGGARDRI